MRSKYLKNRFNTSKEELQKLGNEFTIEALPLSDRLYNLTYWILMDRKSTKKIILQVFSEAIEDCDITKNEADWQSWIQRIWMREILEYYSKKENDKNTDFSFIENFEADFIEVQNLLNAESISKKIIELLQKLPAVLRIPLMMREVAHFDYEKISDLIDVPVGVAATRIHRARKLLYLFLFDKFNFDTEKKNWSDTKRSQSIFELRKCSLLIDEELSVDDKTIFEDLIQKNHSLETELFIQKEIKKSLLPLTEHTNDVHAIKRKIARKASKKFNIN